MPSALRLRTKIKNEFNPPLYDYDYKLQLNQMLSSLIKSADWKAEKHVPAITLLSPFKPGEPLEVEVSVGSGIPHPNTVEHHIAWIALYYVAEGSQLPVELARAEFSAHGPDIFTEPVLRTKIRIPPTRISNSNSFGTLHAVAYCNLHGLWESELDLIKC